MKLVSELSCLNVLIIYYYIQIPKGTNIQSQNWWFKVSVIYNNYIPRYNVYVFKCLIYTG